MITNPKYGGGNIFSQALANLQRQIDQLKNARTPGMLTSRTTTGVHLKPVPGASGTQKSGDKPVYL